VIEGYIGGYSDYLDEKKQKEAVAQGKDKTQIDVPVASAVAAAPVKKLSYKLQFELDNLPAKIAGLEAEISDLVIVLQDADLYQRDTDLFFKASERLEAAKSELEHAEMRWLELEEMVQLITATAPI